METDGTHLFLWDAENIIALNIKTQQKTFLQGHFHTITTMKMCFGSLWSACKEKIVKWDVQTLTKEEEWGYTDISQFFEFYDCVVVIQHNKIFNVGEKVPLTKAPFGTTIHFVSDNCIIYSLGDEYNVKMEDLLLIWRFREPFGIKALHHRKFLVQNVSLFCYDGGSIRWAIHRAPGHKYLFSPDGLFIFVKTFSKKKGLILSAHSGKQWQQFILTDSMVIWHPDSMRLLFENGKSIFIEPYQIQMSLGMRLSLFRRWIIPRL